MRYSYISCRLGFPWFGNRKGLLAESSIWSGLVSMEQTFNLSFPHQNRSLMLAVLAFHGLLVWLFCYMHSSRSSSFMLPLDSSLSFFFSSFFYVFWVLFGGLRNPFFLFPLILKLGYDVFMVFYILQFGWVSYFQK